MTPSDFFRLLYEDVDGGALALWVKDHGSLWYSPGGFEAMERDAKEHRDEHDIYYNVCVQQKKLDSYHRGKAETVCAVPALWLDLDCGKNGKSYFPAKSDAKPFLQDLPLQYSMLIDSGAGLHVYWLLDELYEISKPDERTKIKNISMGWQRFIQQRALALGYEIDSTGDLARVLRVPGTYNHNHGKAPVDMLELHDGRRYSPSEFESYCVGEISAVVTKASGTVIPVHGDMVPPFSKFNTLMTNDTQFAKTWARNRSDMRDTSPSAYCMALADAAVRVGWSDSEITSLLVAFRRDQPDADLKLNRPEWYASTIAKVRGTIDSAEALENVAAISNVNPKQLPEKTDEVLDTVSKAIGIKILGVTKFRPASTAKVRDQPSYEIETEYGIMRFERYENFQSFRQFSIRVGEEFDIVLKPMKGEPWRNILQIMLNVAVHRDSAEEGSEHENVRAAITDMLSDTIPADEIVTAYNQRLPYVDAAGDVHFSWNELSRKLRIELGMHMKNRRLASILEDIGCSKRKFQNIKLPNEKMTSITMWVLR